MLPIDVRLKLLIEGGFIAGLLLYALYSVCFHQTHDTAIVCAVLSVPILIDVIVFHAVRPTLVWLALNVPFLACVAAYVRVKILRKAWPKLRHKLALLVSLLLGE